MNPIPGVKGGVLALMYWDPDGPGPEDVSLVVGGGFTIAGDVMANNIALWNPRTGRWSTLGDGIGGDVGCLGVTADGDLVAGGVFQTAGGVAANNIARWNGSQWSPIGTGLDARVHALALLPTGDLVAGGAFQTAGGVPMSGIARWNGSEWTPLGSGTNRSVRALAVLPGGDLVAGGTFDIAGGVACNRVARWNGTDWAALGGGLLSGNVEDLALLPSGDLVAGGSFRSEGTPADLNGAAAFNFTSQTWSAIGAGPGTDVTSLDVLSDGTLVAGRSSTGSPVVRWDGTGWTRLGGTGGVTTAFAIAAGPEGQCAAGGSLGYITSVASGGTIARWTGAEWLPLSRGVSGNVLALLTLPDGDTLAGGTFSWADHQAANHTARLNAGAWSPLGSGVDGAVYSLASLPGGDIVVGGDFGTVGGVSIRRVARWNGAAWSALGSGMSGGSSASVLAMLVRDGQLIAGGPLPQREA